MAFQHCITPKPNNAKPLNLNDMKVANYVLGFLFSKDGKSVCLIKKNKPEWQKGLLNGVGGKIEDGEEPTKAMVREFEEETGVTIYDWKFFAFMGNDHFHVHCFRAFSDTIKDVKTMEEEEIRVCNVLVTLHGKDEIISNLSWLIPMALDADEFNATVNYVNT